MGDDRRSGRVGVKGPLTTLWDVLKERLAKLIDELGVTKERNVVLENVRQKAVAADRAGRPKSRDIDAQSKYLRKLCATAVLEHRETTEGLLSMCRAGDFEATKAVFWCCWEDHDDVVERCGAAAVSGEVLRRSVYDLHQQLGDSLRPYRKRTASEVRGLVRALTKANALDELERSGRIKRNRRTMDPRRPLGRRLSAVAVAMGRLGPCRRRSTSRELTVALMISSRSKETYGCHPVIDATLWARYKRASGSVKIAGYSLRRMGMDWNLLNSGERAAIAVE